MDIETRRRFAVSCGLLQEVRVKGFGPAREDGLSLVRGDDYLVDITLGADAEIDRPYA